MSEPMDAMLADLLRSRGKIDEAKLAVARAEKMRRAAVGAADVPLTRLLVELGFLGADELAEFLRVTGGGNPANGGVTLADPAPSRPGPTAEPVGMETISSVPETPHGGQGAAGEGAPPPARGSGEPPPPEGRPFGRYQLLAELGRGGMGVVWRAHDRELRREVAVKTVHLEGKANPESIDRLLREARTAATLDHPGIVPIHDVGEVEGVPYFAMARVHGRTFSDALRAGAFRGIRERAQAVCAAAEAVAHAHARQVIHRDLKPSNLFLDESGRVLVMDFGLAKRLDDSTRLTLTGQMLGTPQYMPPEQVEGEVARVGPASDVYSLGAVLYEALTGRPPFEGSTVPELLAKSLSRDPVPPRIVDRRVPEDLDTICMKALQKEPTRRYPSAREFADDLDRWLRGEAILARRETWWGRGVRWASRRKVPTALALATLLGACAALWLGAQAAVARREQRRLAEDQLTALRTTAGLAVDAVLIARRAGGRLTEAENRFVPAVRDAAARVIALRQDLAEPHYFLGRLYRAVMRFPQALEEQERALAKDPLHAPSQYERAVLLAQRYSTRLQEAEARWRARRGAELPDPGEAARGTRAPTPAELEDVDATLAAARAEAVQALERLRATLAATPAWRNRPEALLSVSDARRACAEGLLASYRAGDWETARRGLEAALAADPRLEEAYEGLYEAARRFGRDAEAIESSTRAIAADPGYARHWVNRGKARMDLAVDGWGRGEDPEKAFLEARSDLDRAIDLDERSGAAWSARAALRTNLGVCRRNRGGTAADDFAASIADYDRARRLDPGDVDAAVGRGLAHAAWAETLLDRGEEAGDRFSASIADLEEATRLDPGSADAWMRLGALRLSWARAGGGPGHDPDSLFPAARAALEQSLRLDPTNSAAWVRLGGVESNVSIHLSERGLDASGHRRAALEAFRRGIECDPKSAEAWKGRGTVRANIANAARLRGEDNFESLRAAAADFEKSLELNPSDFRTWSLLASLHLDLSAARQQRGEDGKAELEAALAHLERALTINPGHVESWVRRGTVRMNRGVWRAGRGLDPEPDFASALADFDRALELNPRDANALQKRAALRGTRAVQRQGRGEDPTVEVRAALADFDRALAIGPDSFDLRNNRGALWTNWGNWRQDQGEDASPEYAAALAEYDRALAIDGTRADAWLRRAATRANAGMQIVGRGGDPSELYAGAVADAGEALARDPSSPTAWTTRGVIWMAVGSAHRRRGESPVEAWTAAASDLSRAMAMRPDDPISRFRRGLLFHAWGEFDAGRGEDPRPRWLSAVGDLEAAMRLHPGVGAAEALRDLRERLRGLDPAGSPAAWVTLLGEADRALQANDLDTAGAKFAAGFLAWESRADQTAPTVDDRRTLAIAHYNHACVLGRRLAAGIGEKEAESLRDRAFLHLRETLALGWRDAAHLEQDPDLLPLHADARWAALLRDARGE